MRPSEDTQGSSLDKKSALAHCKSDNNIVVSRHPLDVGPLIILFGITAVLMVYFSAQYPWSIQQVDFGQWFGYDIFIGIPLFGLIPVMLLFLIAHALFNYKHIICDEYILEIEGILELNVRTTRLYYIHIKGVEMDKRLWQRFFNIGDLRMASDVNNQNSEITFKGIYNPRHWKDVIQDRIKSKMEKYRTVPGSTA